MTFGFHAVCLDCNQKYKIRYGLGNNYPQYASFECIKCSKEIKIGYKKFNGKQILEGVKHPEEDFDELRDDSVEIMNLHPEIPTSKDNLNNPFLFQTQSIFANLHKNNEDFEEFKAHQKEWSNFNQLWVELEKPFRIICSKNEDKLIEICGINYKDFVKLFKTWSRIFLKGNQELDFNRLLNQYNNVKQLDIKNHINENKNLLKKVYELCRTYMKNNSQFQSTVFHQKYNWEIKNDMIANINWSDIEKTYGDLYEIIGDFFVLPTMVNNLKNNRKFDEFQSNNFTINKYLKSDKANRTKNFENNDKLIFLKRAYHSGLRNGTHHKNSFLDSDTFEISLGTSKGGTTIKKIALIDYIKSCNELFGVGLMLSYMIVELNEHK